MQLKKLHFNKKNGKIGSWTENHGNCGSASDKRIFYTSITGGSQNNQYATRSQLPAFSATSDHSENGRKHEKKVIEMKNTNAANFANNPQYINLNQPIPQVLYDIYHWHHGLITSKSSLYNEYFPNDEIIKNWLCFGAYIRDILVDFIPQNSTDERIKLSVLVSEIEEDASDNNNIVRQERITGNSYMAYTVAKQILQR